MPTSLLHRYLDLLEAVADAAQGVIDVELPSAGDSDSFVTYALRLGEPRQVLANALNALENRGANAKDLPDHLHQV